MTATGRKKLDELYHPMCERSEFYSMSDLNKPPVLFSPAEDIDKVSLAFADVFCVTFAGVLADVDGTAGLLYPRNRRFSERPGRREIGLSVPPAHGSQAADDTHAQVPQPLSSRRRQKGFHFGRQPEHRRCYFLPAFEEGKNHGRRARKRGAPAVKRARHAVRPPGVRRSVHTPSRGTPHDSRPPKRGKSNSSSIAWLICLTCMDLDVLGFYIHIIRSNNKLNKWHVGLTSASTRDDSGQFTLCYLHVLQYLFYLICSISVPDFC